MRSVSLRLHILAVLAFTAILFVCASGYQISLNAPTGGLDENLELMRAKRQIESFDTEDEYPTTANEQQQDEGGFWDNVVKVALKLFSRFIEWLNS